MNDAELVPLDASEFWQRLREEWAEAATERDEAEQRRAKKDRRALRRRLVAQMLLQGVPRRTMAQVFGVGVGTIQRDVDAVREDWRARSAEDYDRHVAESMARIDQVAQTAMTLMHDTEKSVAARIEAARLVLSAEDRRARLKGLDKPQKLEVSGQIDIAARKARAAELLEAVEHDDELSKRREAKAG